MKESNLTEIANIINERRDHMWSLLSVANLGSVNPDTKVIGSLHFTFEDRKDVKSDPINHTVSEAVLKDLKEMGLVEKVFVPPFNEGAVSLASPSFRYHLTELGYNVVINLYK